MWPFSNVTSCRYSGGQYYVKYHGIIQWQLTWCVYFVFLVQEAVVQYEQYEQEVKDLQVLIEEAHRVIQDRPIPSSSIQELQAQILHHEVQN